MWGWWSAYQRPGALCLPAPHPRTPASGQLRRRLRSTAAVELQTHNATVKRKTTPAGGGVYGALTRLLVVDSTGERKSLNPVCAGGVLQMKQRPRVFYSESQKALMLDRWKQFTHRERPPTARRSLR